MDETAKRAVLRLFSYGLYAVTVKDGGDENGFTANWLSQVSFDPPMLAVSVENTSHSIELIRRTSKLTVNVLPSGARELAGLLGKRWANVPDKLAHVEHHDGPNGCPVLADALGYVECEVESSVLAGDSTVFVLRVVAAELVLEGQPLTMAEAGFRHAG
ncbi:MAG: flavin reductase [Chloroflexi bacterium]|nr:flavin reductase [Chloroflexota bacterium]